MTYESEIASLKTVGKMVEQLQYGFRTLKSAKEMHRRRTMQTILERAKLLRSNTLPLIDFLDRLVEDYEQQIKVEPMTTSPNGLPYDSKLSDLGLPTRAANAMESIGILTLGDLASAEYTDLLKARGFGRTSMRHIEELLERAGVKL